MPRLLAAVLVAGLLAGCGAPPALPDPGAEGPIAIHHWGESPAGPVVVLGRSVTPLDVRYRHLLLRPVLVRLPHARGTVFAAAPQADYRAGEGRAEVAVALGGEGPRPVALSGLLDGAPFVGRAAAARFAGERQALVLDDLVLVSRGQLLSTPQATADQQRIVYRSPRLQAAPPGVAAALAALPARPAFPAHRRGDDPWAGR